MHLTTHTQGKHNITVGNNYTRTKTVTKETVHEDESYEITPTQKAFYQTLTILSVCMLIICLVFLVVNFAMIKNLREYIFLILETKAQ